MRIMRKWLFILFMAVLTSCANRGIGPQGGPKDSIPPVPLHSYPENGAVNFHDRKLEVTFDEYIQLDNIGTNLMMSPPQQNPPDVKARGKRLIVQFQDSLRDSTTYTLDFGSAVCDFREKVPLKGYYFCFSTGPEIDTLESLGRVYDAQNLNPLSGITVGIHSNMADSVFTSEPFLRIAKTDADGWYRIANIHPGRYRLYAVDDMSRDYRLTYGEALAFMDEPVSILHPDVTHPHDDSIPADTVPADSIHQHADSIPADSIHQPLHSHHHPETVSLFLFKEQQQKLYLQRSVRDKQHLVTVSFSAPPDSMPFFRPLRDSLAWIAHYSAHYDTVQLWLTDSSAISVDSLYFETRYRRTDSLNRLEWCTDTIQALWREPKMTAKARENQERQNRNRRLDIRTNARKDFEVYDTLRLTVSTPLAAIAADSIRLYERIDTVLKPMPFSFAPYDTLPMQLSLLADLKPGGEYELHLDSGAMHDVYGVTHISAIYPLQLKKTEDYSTLRVRLVPFEPQARIQLLSNKDEVLRELPAAEDGAFFEHLKPDTYYMRLYLDTDGNGRWTTGSWEEKRQPEKVYYFPEKIQTKSNWDFEQEWDYHAVEQTKAKPAELIQAAPKKK